MIELGYWLSSEEHAPNDLVGYARMAERTGFSFVMISDHYHPWTDRQGRSPFVWSVVGGIAATTKTLRLGTGVTCPIIRVHPAIIAQAAATAACMMPGRFFLGVGTGERLNEHIVGIHWPPPGVRLEMLEEAIGVIRDLWKGRMLNHRGRHFTVEEARLYTLPDEPPPLLVAARGPKALELAGRLGDGLVGVEPNAEAIRAFEAAGGLGKPRYGQLKVCWAQDERTARRIAHEWWPNAGLPGSLKVELALPSHIEQAISGIGEDEIARAVVCGPDPEPHIAAIQKFADAGFDHLSVHQIGPFQEGFFEFYETQILPRLHRPNEERPQRGFA